LYKNRSTETIEKGKKGGDNSCADNILNLTNKTDNMQTIKINEYPKTNWNSESFLFYFIF